MTDPAESLDRRRMELETSIAELTAELERVNTALEVLARNREEQSVLRFTLRRRSDREPTLKQMAFTVLADAQRSLTAGEVLARIEEQFQTEIPRTSMSPQLSRLGQNGILLRKGNRWRINPDLPKQVAREFYVD